MSVWSRRMKSCVSTMGCFSTYWRHGAAFGDFSTFRKALFSYIHLSIQQGNIFTRRYSETSARASKTVSGCQSLTIFNNFSLLGLEFVSELFPVKVAILPKDLTECSINGEFITQNMRTPSSSITINKMEVMFLFYRGSY